jgi:hypothetical protein
MGRPSSYLENPRWAKRWASQIVPMMITLLIPGVARESRSDKEQGWLSKREDAVTNNLHFACSKSMIRWLENEMNTGEHRDLGWRGPEAPAPFFFLHPSRGAEPHVRKLLPKYKLC